MEPPPVMRTPHHAHLGAPAPRAAANITPREEPSAHREAYGLWRVPNFMYRPSRVSRVFRARSLLCRESATTKAWTTARGATRDSVKEMLRVVSQISVTSANGATGDLTESV